MAITIDDFSKIWASTSPLTPYEFSESNYKEGWNFIGGTPPSRQMWDFLQKQNDEKLKYLLDNFGDYLPLAGGTMTGDIILAGGEINNVDDSTIVKIQGGTAEDKGGRLVLFGKDFSNAPDFAGCAELTASDGSNSKSLRAYPDGTLTWGGAGLGGTVLGETTQGVATNLTLPKNGTYLIITGHNSTPGTNSIWIARTGGNNVFKMAGGANITMTCSGTQITVTSSSGIAGVFYIYLGSI